MKEKLTIKKLKAEAKAFCIAESKIKNKDLFGITDGKAVGTHIEHKFQERLNRKFLGLVTIYLCLFTIKLMTRKLRLQRLIL